MENGPVNPYELLIHLPDDTQKFMANGKMYFIERDATRLSLERFIEYERQRIQWAFSSDFDYIRGKHQEAMRYCNPEQYQMAFTILFNLDLGALDLKSKRSVEMMICTLFISAEGEDVTTWSTALAKQKIEDWTKEGLSVGFFLRFAVDIVNTLTERYKALFREFSDFPKNPIAEEERENSLTEIKNITGPFLDS